jgi:hypothetical protein
MGMWRTEGGWEDESGPESMNHGRVEGRICLFLVVWGPRLRCASQAAHPENLARIIPRLGGCPQTLRRTGSSVPSVNVRWNDFIRTNVPSTLDKTE